jgi:hypothetical protein
MLKKNKRCTGKMENEQQPNIIIHLQLTANPNIIQNEAESFLIA